MTGKPALRTALLFAPLLGLMLGGCDTIDGWFTKTPPPPLAGKRVAVLTGERTIQADPELAGTPVVLPPQENNATWAQAGGNAEHNPGHLALSATPALAWKSSIGSGTNSQLMLVGAPVVAGGRVFAMDVDSRVTALDAQTGGQAWRVDLQPKEERGNGIDGGVAFADGRLYAASGYGELLALDANTGAVVWRKRLGAPVRGAPTVAGSRVFVSTLDNQTFAFATTDGRALWNQAGILETAGMVGSTGPAATATMVVVGYSSGEIFGLRADNGRVGWIDSLAGLRRGGALNTLADIRGLPVIDRGQIFAISQAGRMGAIDERVGGRMWEAEIGGIQTPAVGGGFVFVVSNDNDVAALARQSGRARWVTSLPRYSDLEAKKGAITWSGPVLAGGRLWLAGSNAQLVGLDPADGRIVATLPLPNAAFSAPVVAGGTLYVLCDDATIAAYR